MAQHKQALKRHRQSLKRRARNSTVKSRLRNEITKFQALLGGKDVKNLQEMLQKTISLLDKAAGKGIIPKKRASRHAARLSAAAHRVAAPAPTKKKRG